MAKVFFGCSMRGGHNQASREELLNLRGSIEELGHELVSKHQLKEGIVKEEMARTNEEIHDRDYNWLKESDVGIFEISNPSLGTGGEITDMAHLGKPVLCLFKKSCADFVSAYIRGKQGSEFVTTPFECSPYETLEEAKQLIKKFVEKYL